MEAAARLSERIDAVNDEFTDRVKAWLLEDGQSGGHARGVAGGQPDVVDTEDHPTRPADPIRFLPAMQGNRLLAGALPRAGDG